MTAGKMDIGFPVRQNDRHSRAERERLFFEAMMRILDRESPGYAD